MIDFTDPAPLTDERLRIRALGLPPLADDDRPTLASVDEEANRAETFRLLREWSRSTTHMRHVPPPDRRIGVAS